MTQDDYVRVPVSAVNFQIRLCIIRNCGHGGQNSVSTTYENIWDLFGWESMRSDIVTFYNT